MGRILVVWSSVGHQTQDRGHLSAATLQPLIISDTPILIQTRMLKSWDGEPTGTYTEFSDLPGDGH